MSAVSRLAKGVLELLARVVAPSRCAACDASVRYGRAFCPPCAVTLLPASNPDPSRFAAFVYGGAMAEAIRRFKFDDRPDLARPLSFGVITRLPRLNLTRSAVVVPVPLHPGRLVERGYNQAALLARGVARHLEVPCAPRALVRARPTARQTDLNRRARGENVALAFVVPAPLRFLGRTVVLVDDVETTGSTLAACRAALVGCGARDVCSVVVARAEG